jgi:hypothetical protein
MPTQRRAPDTRTKRHTDLSKLAKTDSSTGYFYTPNERDSAPMATADFPFTAWRAELFALAAHRDGQHPVRFCNVMVTESRQPSRSRVNVFIKKCSRVQFPTALLNIF